jgi:glyoxylase-like metal-dependent hydrolase (beta-lactamase superfamily II)
MDARCFTVGMVAENTWLARRERSGDERAARGRGSDRALLIDPGDEPERLQDAIEQLGVTVEAILVTHCHFDHVGAVAPMARATGAPVYCPKLEAPVLADIMRWVPWPGIGPFESYDADVLVEGGERLELAGFEIDVLFTPGHSPGHVTYSIPAEQAMFSGDVLFQNSIGRTDLPGGDTQTLMATIGGLLEALPDETRVLPGHMGTTTLGAERRSNPFLHALPA